MNKSLITNITSLIIIIVGANSPVYSKEILSVGFFAFSGAITNWLAVYMLFDKVPGLYGSGVIPNRFEEFKSGIKHLIMSQFFTNENIDRFFQSQESSKDSAVSSMNFSPLLDAVNYEKVFTDLTEVVLASPLGGMLAMFGGESALDPLKDPFVSKMKVSLQEMIKSKEFIKALEENILPSNISEEVISKIEEVVNTRLEELTPELVKDIIQEMIRKHLGWLVVWGGVFGGLIGLVMSYVS